MLINSLKSSNLNKHQIKSAKFEYMVKKNKKVTQELTMRIVN